MNVIIANKYKTLLAGLDIDVIKRLDGEFEVSDIITNFTNFYFNKMILDITAIKNYKDIKNIQDLSVNMDMNKVIILLDDSEESNNPRFLSQLVSMGVYNFTRNIDAINFLMNNPNTYKDVAHYHQLNAFNIETPSSSTGQASSVAPTSPSENIVQNTQTLNPILSTQRIIGVKNYTYHAGSTTLTYMLKKHLEKQYKVVAVEVDGNDFMYLNDRTLKNISAIDLPSFISRMSDAEIILVDLNNSGDTSMCTEVLYLIEPGLIKLNKLIRQDRKVFEKLRDKKIVLNRSVLNTKDVDDFEYESRSKVYFNVPYLDDKLDYHPIIVELLVKLGFNRFNATNETGKGSKLFNIFK